MKKIKEEIKNQLRIMPEFLVVAIITLFAGITTKSETQGEALGLTVVILLCTGRIIFEIQNQNKDKQ